MCGVQSADAPNAGAQPSAGTPARDGEVELLRRVRLLARTLLATVH